MQIETDRLRLRELEPGDWETLHRYQSLPEVQRHSLPGQGTAVYTRAWVQEVIKAAGCVPRQFYGFAVTRKDDGAVIGTCSLTLASGDACPAQMGWDVDPQHWGHGYATEAARALLDFGCRHLGLTRVAAQCFANNAASRRVMEKIGMRRRRLGVMEDWGKRLLIGRLRPWVEYEILSVGVDHSCP